MPRLFPMHKLLALAVLAFAGTLHATSALKPNFLFSDNMVLQRDRPVPVWGEAPAGAQVRVSLLEKSASATAGPDGKWSVKLDPFPAGGPHEMSIESGSEKLAVKNVLVGDVWFCSGQSNMAWAVKSSKDANTEIPAANHPNIRFLTIPQHGAMTPQDDLPGVAWQVCTPETAAEFSALAYYFGRGLQEHNKIPVGLINSSWGGSQIQTWTSLPSLETQPDLAGITQEYHWTVSRFKKNLEAGVVDGSDTYVDPGLQPDESGLEAPDLDDAKWASKPDVPKPFNVWGAQPYTQGAVWFRRSVEIPEAWKGQELELKLGSVANSAIVYFQGTEVGRILKGRAPIAIAPDLVAPGKAVIAVRVFNSKGGGGITGFPEWEKKDISLARKADQKDAIPLSGAWKYKVTIPRPVLHVTADPGSHKLPSSLFNNMVSPLVPFALRGFVWYQGENNITNAWQYKSQLPTLIRCWREAWNEELPFLYYQLPGLGGASKGPQDDSGYNDSWCELRDSQWAGLTEPRTIMVAGNDLGGPGANIHPPNKQEFAARLCTAARALAYGEAIEGSGPLYAGMSVENGKVRVKFTNVGGGLVAKGSDAGELQRFAVAGPDRKYVWANARIEGDTVVAWSDEVPNPVAVSYAWALNPVGCNLFNKDGLAAPSFRSDDWPTKTTGRKAPY